MEELKVETSESGKITKRHQKMEEHEAPLIFEETFVKHRGTNQIIDSTKVKLNGELAQKIDPTGGLGSGLEFQS